MKTAHCIQFLLFISLLLGNFIVWLNRAPSFPDCAHLSRFCLGFSICLVVMVMLMVMRTQIIFREQQTALSRPMQWVELVLQVAMFATFCFCIAGMVWLAGATPSRCGPFFALAMCDVVLFVLTACCCGLCNALIITRTYDAAPEHDPDE